MTVFLVIPFGIFFKALLKESTIKSLLDNEFKKTIIIF